MAPIKTTEKVFFLFRVPFLACDVVSRLKLGKWTMILMLFATLNYQLIRHIYQAQNFVKLQHITFFRMESIGKSPNYSEMKQRDRA